VTNSAGRANAATTCEDNMTAHTDPLKLENLISWLETMPPDEEYSFSSRDNCLLAQFLKSCGCEEIWVGGFTFDYDDNKGVRIPATHSDIASEGEYTFGAATLRAREAFAGAAP
jgi:hypothetical protein